MLVSLAMSATLIGQAFLVSAVLIALYRGAGFADVSGLLAGVAVLVVVRSGLAWLREVSVLFTAAAVKERLRARVLDMHRNRAMHGRRYLCALSGRPILRR